MARHVHRKRERGAAPIPAAVIVTTDSRGPATDRSGKTAADLLAAAGCRVAPVAFSPNRPGAIRAAVKKALAAGARVVVCSGGTGVGPRDLTVETVAPLCDKTLEGFGEIFRALSYGEIGPAAMLSRACLGVRRGRVLVCLPGSPGAVRLALKKIVLPELRHLLAQAAPPQGGTPRSAAREAEPGAGPGEEGPRAGGG
jgi:molybdenum cofactor biosynthesis protein B